MIKNQIKILCILTALVSLVFISNNSFADMSGEDYEPEEIAPPVKVEIIPPTPTPPTPPPMDIGPQFCEDLNIEEVKELIRKIKSLDRFAQSKENDFSLRFFRKETEALLFLTEDLLALPNESYEDGVYFFDSFIDSAENLKYWIINNLPYNHIAYQKVKNLWPEIEYIANICNTQLSPWEEPPQRTQAPPEQIIIHQQVPVYVPTPVYVPQPIFVPQRVPVYVPVPASPWYPHPFPPPPPIFCPRY